PQARLRRRAQEGLGRFGVVLHTRRTPLVPTQGRSNQLGTGGYLSRRPAETDVESLADVAIRHGVAGALHLQVAIGMHLGRRPANRLPWLWWQRQERTLFVSEEGLERLLVRGP